MKTAAHEQTDFLALVILGASGDLARRKIYPALFALFCQDYLPERFRIYGYARSGFTREVWAERIYSRLTCRYTPDHSCAARMDSFMEHCAYRSGSYDSPSGFRQLREEILADADGARVNVLIYFALPSNAFLSAAGMIHQAGWTGSSPLGGWLRCVMEKPFGYDLEGFRGLTSDLSALFDESQIYRIDHYLGKEIVQNLMVLRFGNLVFEPLWNRHSIERVEFSCLEDIGVEGRGAYFDRYGIIRDIMQNHMLQMAALTGMEHPGEIPGGVRDAKVNFLKAVAPVQPDSCVLGQYGEGTVNGVFHNAYTEEESVWHDSHTPTYAECLLRVNNPRWAGVPFVFRAGKGCAERKTEIQLTFRKTPSNPFEAECGPQSSNRLVIRVQPDEQIVLRIHSKCPGLDWRIEERNLQLHYESAFRETIPDAYEALLLEVLKGDRSLFLRYDELELSWAIFTPLLQAADNNLLPVSKYAFGSNGPPAIL